jgi:hypothetical protein
MMTARHSSLSRPTWRALLALALTGALTWVGLAHSTGKTQKGSSERPDGAPRPAANGRE